MKYINLILFALLLLFSLTSLGQQVQNIENPEKTLKTYNIVYLHEDDYTVQMNERKISEWDLYKYFLDETGKLIPFFFSVEEAMANMRGFHPRSFESNPNNTYTVYILDDYCCGDNAGFPSTLSLMGNNEINLTFN